MPPNTVHVVPHTHWDREWYLPFQTFRARLAELLDGLIALMADHPEFRFTLDGQLATVDDYLELRPEAEPTLRRLIAEGRLAVGPWQILMDEFCVDGETMVRNLELGWRRGSDLGGAMPVGYLPDMFGHVAQMPQILRRAGIEHAVVWRGVPVEVDRHAFAWEGIDGSVVRTEYLVGGYGNAAALFELPDRVERKVAAYADRQRPFFGDDELLAMVGGDHVIPSAAIATLSADLNAAGGSQLLRLATVHGYLQATADGWDGLPRVAGELRSGARANVLMGVTSARIDTKAACARAERGLTRLAEPLAALHLGAERWPADLLDLAWRRVVDNSAHDSICGCSVDQVVDQVLVRFAEASQLVDTIVGRAAAAVGARTRRGTHVVLNPSPFERTDLADVEVPVPPTWGAASLALADGTVLPTQETDRSAPLLLGERLPGARVPTIFDRMHGRELFGRALNAVELDVVDGRHRATFHVDHDRDPLWVDVDELREQVEVAVGVAADDLWDVRILARARRRLVAAVPVPALGTAAVHVVEGVAPHPRPVRVTDGALDNGLVRVAVAPDGTLDVTGDGVRLTGVGRLVDGGEAGDSYNYAAPPPRDRLVDTPEAVRVRAGEQGPLRASLTVERDYRWPCGLAADAHGRSGDTVPVTVTSHVEVRADEPFVRVRLAFTNAADDHRLRWHLPLPAPVERSWAEGQYAVVERGLTCEAGYGEHPLPTFPARGFVATDGVALLLDHLTEYEVTDGRELALTVLRSTGMISRNTNPYREDPAGPEVAIPAAQLHGRWSFGFAVMPTSRRWDAAGVLAAAERYQLGFVTAPGTGDEAASDAATGLAVDGDNVVLHALRRRDEGWLELRVANQQSVAASATVRGGIGEAREADLLGRPGAALPVVDGALDLDLGPWEIRTGHLRRP